MEIDIVIVLWILFIHWIADFVLQTDKQAKMKSSNNWYLLAHTSIYAVTTHAFWGFIMPAESGFELFIYGVLITFVVHTITDYITSRLNSYLWKKGDVHNFFVSIGLDQFLHFIQLIFTYKILFL